MKVVHMDKAGEEEGSGGRERRGQNVPEERRAATDHGADQGAWQEGSTIKGAKIQ